MPNKKLDSVHDKLSEIKKYGRNNPKKKKQN